MHAIEGICVAGTGRCNFVLVHIELVTIGDGEEDCIGDSDAELFLDDIVVEAGAETKTSEDAIIDEGDETTGEELDEGVMGGLAWGVVCNPDGGLYEEESEVLGAVMIVVLLIDVVVVQ
jgi:hypothetical protein